MVTNHVTKTIKNFTQVEKYLPENEITAELRKEVENLTGRLPVISYLRNPSLKQRHWLRIEALLGRR